jgi:hypothetical protein
VEKHTFLECSALLSKQGDKIKVCLEGGFIELVLGVEAVGLRLVDLNQFRRSCFNLIHHYTDLFAHEYIGHGHPNEQTDEDNGEYWG